MNIKPFETLIAEAIAGAVISGGQNGDAAKIVKRANTALAIASAFGQLSNGDAAPGVQAIATALNNADLDPGVALAVQGLFGMAGQQAALIATINSAIPGLGTVATSIMANVSAGVTAAAQAEIAKYGAKPAA